MKYVPSPPFTSFFLQRLNTLGWRRGDGLERRERKGEEARKGERSKGGGREGGGRQWSHSFIGGDAMDLSEEHDTGEEREEETLEHAKQSENEHEWTWH